MSTRATKSVADSVSINLGYEGNNIPTDFTMPSCTVEDVDRALFNLFDKQLPFEYQLNKSDNLEGSIYAAKTKRVPVIFATGERFALLSRKEPLRAKDNILILPLVSIRRTAIDGSPSMGAGTNQIATMRIKTRLSPEDPRYQNILNKLNLNNSPDIASNSSFADPTNQVTGSIPGSLATRRNQTEQSSNSRKGYLLTSDIGNNFFEIITLPPPKYFVATYEVTFWTQYTQQMNQMITSLMSMEQDFHQRTFKLETDKGYWFIAYVGEAFSDGGNATDFSEDERLVRYSFEVKVPGYIIAADSPGLPNPLRSFISAPQISFEIDAVAGVSIAEGGVDAMQVTVQGIASGNSKDYILDDTRTIDDPLPGQAIGENSFASADPRRMTNGQSIQDINDFTTSVGNSESGTSSIVKFSVDPITGQRVSTSLRINSRNTRKGETVYKTPF